MADRRKRWASIVIAAGLALVAAGLWLVLRPPGGGRGTTDGGAAAADGAAAEAVAAVTPAPRPPVDGPARAGRARPPALGLVTATAVRDEAAGPGAFEGVVASWSTGEGVAGAELTFAHAGAVSSTRSDRDGRFRFEAAEPGAYELVEVTAEGYLPYAPEWGHSPVRLVARPAVVIRGIAVTLRPAIDYRGTVLDPAGQPVAGATVRIVSTPGGDVALEPIEDRFTADARGRFVFHAPDDAVLEARHPDFSRGLATLDGAAQVSHELTIRLGPPGEERASASLSGVVVDARGDGVEDALVTCRRAGGERGEEPGAGAQATSDAEGRFALEGLAPGPYMVTAVRAGSAPARIELVEAGASDLRLVLEQGATVTGMVRDAETGDVLAGFSVVALRRVGELGREPERTATVFDGEGRYELDGLGPGDYDVVATARDFAPSAPGRVAVADPPPGEPIELDLSLGRGGRVSGRVIDSVSRQPLEHARVSVEAALGPSATVMPLLASATTDAAGAFEIRGLAAGLRSVHVAAAGHHRRIISGLPVEADGSVGPLEIDLRPVAEGEEPALELTGIGAVLAAEGDALVIGRLIPGGGAAEAGLQSGDGILAIDGASVVDLGFEGSIERIRGPEGSTVRLTVRRAGSGEVQDLDVPRRRIAA